MSDRNETAIDIIYKTFDMMADLDKKIGVLDYNMKLLSNKLSKLQQMITDSMELSPEAKAAKAAPVASPTASVPKEIRKETSERRKPDRMVLGNIKVFAHILDNKKSPVKGAEIDIYNEANELVKVKDTDDAGYWEVRLPPGSYRAEMKMKGYATVSRPFVLSENISEFNLR